MKEGADADAAVADAQRRTTSRRELSRHPRFEQVSPKVGRIDEDALGDIADDDLDEALGLLADMTQATDPALRDLARRLAGRLFLELSMTGRGRPRGVGRLRLQRFAPDRGDLDLDGSIDELLVSRARRAAADPDELRVRGWIRPGMALSLLVDRSGSMGGKPLATAAVAAAAVAFRASDDYSVLAFGPEVIVPKSQDVAKPPSQVVGDLLALRGFGTTDVAGALRAAGAQLGRSTAGRKVVVLLSDCRATVPGDVVSAARALDELCVLAPSGDVDEARVLATAAGARLAVVSGPSDVVDALTTVLAG